jgi:hypothetical protein
MVLCLQQIYQELSLYILFYTLPIIYKLLQCFILLAHILINLEYFLKNFEANLFLLQFAINSDSIMDLDMQVYL